VNRSAIVVRGIALALLGAPWTGPIAQGAERRTVTSDGTTLANGALRFALDVSEHGPRPIALDSAYDRIDSPLRGELFEIQARDGKRLRASDSGRTLALRLAPFEVLVWDLEAL
jgi:hypothetical protein